MSTRPFVMVAAGFMFVGVALGAFGAHGLRSHFERFPELLDTYNTAVRYHMLHGLALLAAAWVGTEWSGFWSSLAGYLFIAGIVIFSGSLYLLVFTRIGWLGAITPIGGVAFLAGWICLILAVWRN